MKARKFVLMNSHIPTTLSVAISSEVCTSPSSTEWGYKLHPSGGQDSALPLHFPSHVQLPLYLKSTDASLGVEQSKVKVIHTIRCVSLL